MQFGMRLRQSQLHVLGGNGPARAVIQLLQHHYRAFGGPLRAFDPKRFIAPRDSHIKRCLDAAQVFVKGTTNMGDTSVIGRNEGVSEDQWQLVELRPG